MSRRPPVLPDTHEFVRLSDGRCHYRVDGSGEAGTVLLIHGATVPAWEFDRLVPFLVAAGYRTLRADLYGHGWSDRPRAVYGHDMFVRQMTELLDAVPGDEPVHVLGHSLGAAIGARLACREPDRVASLVLAAPLLDFTVQARATRLLRVPLLGETLVPLYVLPMLVRRRTLRYRDIEDGRFVGMFRDQLRLPGYGRALLSLFRSGALGDQSDCYAALADAARPVLLLRGVDDAILPPAQVAAIRRLVPQARHLELAGTAHSFIITHPEKVAPPVLEFLATAGRDRE